MNAQKSLARGFSMIEVLVTIVIIAFGLLGLASLVLRGIQSGSDSTLRNIAVKQAYDMADRLRSNPAGVSAGSYNALGTNCTTLLSNATSSGNPIVTAQTSAPACTTSGASAVGATNDYNCWQRNNFTLLPNGSGAVCKDATNRWYGIFVSWDEGKTGTTNKTFWMTFEP